MGVEFIELHDQLAATLGRFKHDNSKRMLLALCRHESVDVRETAAKSLLLLYRQEVRGILDKLSADPVINQVLADSPLTVTSLPTRA